MDQIKVFSPATVANVSCGYDAMGFALETLGDDMIFTKTKSKDVVISKIEGANLPYEAHKNAAGVVAQMMLKDSNANFGLDIQIFKNFKPGSGLGSSAASASGTAFAVNQLLGNTYSNLELTKFAMQGEVVACGSAIADNVAAAIYGGFILVRSYKPLDIVSIPTPTNLVATIIHPQIEIKTEDARKVVPTQIELKTAITQWSNVGGLISGLHSNNFDLIGRSLVDLVAEPNRKKLIPLFDDVKHYAISAGALGAGISGSGPSIFALSKNIETAKKVEEAMDAVYKNSGIEYSTYVSHISKTGTRIQ
ncbi:MAG: homoserine kinase [Flavobacteriaceae bacterium]|uniref:homoserine kinase n=1 Tax=Winogradskyella poriferorum TaxID=307627 RepID=UPI000C498E1B|nr:homoserine kinase [Flavobacteriaceae bacterium]MBD09516.1 homoserine kinase [Flavobacteriaceae bacterium]|tara:strand:+ start:1894 stop:2814 length:921 start_codon:yes stop_codon:yes gene_type:complete